MKFKRNLLFLIGFSVIITSCGFSGAYVDSRREAGLPYKVGTSSADKIVVCYNSEFVTPEEIKSMAQAECDKVNSDAVFRSQDNTDCSLFVPIKATFDCIDRKTAKPVILPANPRKEKFLKREIQ